MLAIRMQRTGRKGHAQFRLIVQESRRSPSSGNVVAALGSYDPHTKAVILDKEKAATFLSNGAQPSPRVIMLLQQEGVKLPSWVNVDNTKQRSIKHTDKLRRNRPNEPEVKESAAEKVAEEVSEVTPTEVTEAQPAVEESSSPSEVIDTSSEAVTTDTKAGEATAKSETEPAETEKV